jgi:Flp pilus assembly protein TadG
MNKVLPVTLRVLKDESAVVSIMLAGTMLFGIAVAGFAVDYGRAEFAKVELQNALDAGALAGARSSPLNATEITKEALTYFGANWGAPFGSHVVDGSGNPTQPNYVVSSGVTTITGNASINVNTTMLWAIGEKTMLAKAFNVVALPETGGLEVAMVLDNTGSQAQGCKMNYIVQAAQGFVNQLYGVANPLTTGDVVQPPSSSTCSAGNYAYTIPSYSSPAEITPPPGLWISVVPFVTSVAPVSPSTTTGSDYQNWITNKWIDTTRHFTEFPPNASAVSGAPWGGCVEARLFTAAGDTTQDPYGGEDPVATSTAAATTAWNGIGGHPFGVELAPSQAAFEPYFYPSDTDVMPDPVNPSWAANNADTQVTNYFLVKPATPTTVSLTTSNLQGNNPGTVTTGKNASMPLLSTTGAFTSGGAPNAPYWPAFNEWSQSQVGASPVFNDNVQNASLPENQFILQTFLNGAGNEVLSGSSNTSTYPDQNQSIILSTTTDPTLSEECSNFGVPDCHPIFVPGIPSNPPSGFYNLGPNLGCPISMLPFSTDYSQIMSKIASMFPVMVGGTVTDVGLAWGFRVLSPNWQGVWNAGQSTQTNNLGQTLPLPYNDVVHVPGGGNIAINKVVIFMTDGNNQWGLTNLSTGANFGDNTYTAYRTLDHTPLLDQPGWTNSTDMPANKGGVIPAAQSTLSNMVTRANEAVDPPATFEGSTIGGDGNSNSETANAWALCQAMQNEGITMFTVLLEFNEADISTATANGYKQYCSTDPNGGAHFFELTGTQVSQLANVFTSIANSVTTLRLVQ